MVRSDRGQARRCCTRLLIVLVNRAASVKFLEDMAAFWWAFPHAVQKASRRERMGSLQRSAPASIGAVPSSEPTISAILIFTRLNPAANNVFSFDLTRG